MKKIILILTISIFAINYVISQDKKIIKIETAYNSGDYDDCIKRATKYTEKNSKNSLPYYYMGFSNFQKSKKEKGVYVEKYLQRTTTNLYKASYKDKNKENFNKFETELTEIHDSMLVTARKYHKIEAHVGKAEYYFKKLVEIFNDTTEEYRDIFIPKPPCWEQKLGYSTYAGTKNQIDMKGMKQGLWVEVYETGCIKYEINFKDGKPVGLYRKYFENGNLQAKIYFDDNSERASAILYNENEQKVAIGYYVDKQKDSTWQYFKRDSILLKEENYKNGVLNGREITLSLNNYPLALEIKYWKNGKQDSIWTRNYYSNGETQFYCYMRNGKREGTYTHYFQDKSIEMQGMYKKGLREGSWKFYDLERREFFYVNYSKGVAENQEELTKRQTEILNQDLKNRNNINEPIFNDFE